MLSKATTERLLAAIAEYQRMLRSRSGDPNRLILKRVASEFRFTWQTLRDAVQIYEEISK